MKYGIASLALRVCVWVCAPLSAGASDDIVFADFESADYGGWVATGAAFGAGPAAGTLPNQMPVSGFQGKRLVNSYTGGDASTGTLTSPEFTIERKYIAFLIGGGGYEGKTCMNLLIDGRVARAATGSNLAAGGSDALESASWDVSELTGKPARLQIVDDATGGWGHINVDQIVFTDTRPASLLRDAERTLRAERKYLQIPVRRGARKHRMEVDVAGRTERTFEIELADGQPDWWAVLDIAAWQGQPLTVRVDRLRDGSTALASLRQADSFEAADELYREPLRPQFHFSARRGWLNDPNGLVFFDGEYHLFFQHNPYGWDWGNMHWGHAVSRDLLQWKELGEALYPDALGPMFSGSAVVDWQDTSGFGRDGKPPLVLIYTAAGDPTVQCLAYSTDRGRTFSKYTGNPVLEQLTPGNRDPKVLWHEPSRQWVMVLYVQRGEKPTIEFFTSPDLKQWTSQSAVEPFFECPDLFELRVGETAECKWVLTAASSEYMLGTFDGRKFTPETPKLPGHRGRGFYAAQTFSDMPADDGRRIQIGWLQAPSPGMPFNQAMSVPLELSLRETPEGVRMAWQPVRELEQLRGKSHSIAAQPIAPGKNALSELSIAGPLELRVEFEPGDAKQIALNVRGVPVLYDCAKQEIAVNGHRAPAPLVKDRQRWIVLLDRTSVEVFAADGLTYIPMPVLVDAANASLGISAEGGVGRLVRFDVHELRSIWEVD
ncbi:MAG TPA: glycoside hydrolase family 32 protein [Pirellulales bacterium]|nr:glycoside hydrolase family 32 protein [Pirellulales bacterium]